MSAAIDLLSSGGSLAAWTAVVGEAAAKGTLLLLAATLVSLALRRASAASRHMVWAFCLFLLLTLPFLAQVAPTVPVLVIPTTWTAAWDRAAEMAAAGISEMLTRGGAASHSSAIDTVIDPEVLESAEIIGSTTLHLETLTLPARPRVPTTGWLFVVWLTGATLVMGWLAIGLSLRWSLSRRARVARSGPWAESVRRIAAHLGIRREIVILMGSEDAVPMTWGSVRPVIYLPPGAEAWSEDQLRSVLLHELAHVRRWDSLTRSISQLACAVFWFHPLAWYGAHRLLREQERACDDVVLLAGAAPDEYATTLLTLARQYRRRRPAVVGALALARRTTLETRLISILDPQRKRITMSRTQRVVLSAVFVAVAIPLASLRPAPAATAMLANPSVSSMGSGAGPAPVGRPEAVLLPWTEGTTSPTTQEVMPVQMIIKGEVHIGSSLDEVEVGPGGRFVLQEIEDVESHLELDEVAPARGRRLEISADEAGNVERTWSVDGVTGAIDDDARSWIDEVLGRLDHAHVELSPTGADETRTLIFSGDKLALIGEAHAVAEAHAVEGEHVVHLEPAVPLTDEEGAQVHIHLAKPVGLEEGAKIDIQLAHPIVVEEGGKWTIHLSHPDIDVLKEHAVEGLVLELQKKGGDKSFTILVPEVKVLREGEEGKVIITIPEGGLDVQDLSAVVVRPKVRISEEGGEAHAYVVVEPRIAVEPEIVTEAMVHPSVHIEIKDDEGEESRTIVIARGDESDPRHNIHISTKTDEGGYLEVSIRGEVDLGGSVDEIEVGEGGELTIDARDADGVIRQLSVRSGPDGDLIYEFHVDGEQRPFDAEARAWLQEILDRIES